MNVFVMCDVRIIISVIVVNVRLKVIWEYCMCLISMCGVIEKNMKNVFIVVLNFSV